MARLGFALAVIPLACVACGPSLNYAYMAKDSSGSLKTTKFATLGDEIHCVMEEVGGDEETVISMALTGPEGVALSDNEYYPRPDPKKSGPVSIDIQLFQLDALGERIETGPWPLGNYLLEVYLDHSREESLDFEVVN